MKAKISISKRGSQAPLAGFEVEPCIENCVIAITIVNNKGKHIGYVRLDDKSVSMTDESGVCLMSAGEPTSKTS